MIWVARLIYCFLLILIFEGVYALLGLLFTCFSYRKHPWLHRMGLFFLARSGFTYNRVLPRRCQMCCGVDRCRNWTCPGQEAYRKDPHGQVK